MGKLIQNDIWRISLARFYQRALACAELSPIYLESVKLQSLYEQFEEDVTKVCFIGFVSNGKTSLINALLGVEVLPIDDVSCTNNMVQEIKYGPNPKGILHFTSPFPTEYRETLSDDILYHLKYYNYGKNPYGGDIQIPELEYSFKDCLQYFKRPDINLMYSEDTDRAWEYIDNYINTPSAFECIELFYPSDILKKRIALIDTEGITDSLEYRRAIFNRASKSDIVLLVSDGIRPLSIFDKDIIDELQIHQISLHGIVVNRMDLVFRSERLKLFIRVLAQNYVPNDAIIFVSSREALQAYKEKNSDLLQQSGFLEAKAFIENLAEQKERERFVASAKALNEVVCNYMLPLLGAEINKSYEKYNSSRIGDLIFISSDLKSTAEGLKRLVNEIEAFNNQ